jgi:alpha-amylase
MKRLGLIFVLASCVCSSPSSANTHHVLLQGFHYNSSGVESGWYVVLKENAQRIKDSGFTLVWAPPPSKSVTPLGYEPTELNNFNSAYGSKRQLRGAIRALTPEVKMLADIVINHRSGTHDACTFTNPPWPQHTIVKDDEECAESDKSINSDGGDPVPFSRDLDHLNPTTKNGIKTWMRRLRNDVGFAGWRYDLVKGYIPSVIREYNDATTPLFSVGEYFDYDTQKVIDWIDSTHSDPAKRSRAFDFPFRKALYQAVAWRDYHFLKYHDRAAGVIGVWSDKAVTFLENHDTEEARNGRYAPPFPGPDQHGDQMIQGYAVILTHPGTPSVFWRDIYDSGPVLEAKLRELIKIRRQYCVHSKSGMFVDTAREDAGYAAYIEGDRGELAVKIGPFSWSPEGEKWDSVADLLASGNDYAVWGEHGVLSEADCN